MPHPPKGAEVGADPTKGLSLEEAFYQGHLDDLAARHDASGLEGFILNVFGAQSRLLSDAQKRHLGERLLVWTAVQTRPVRTLVWRTFARCHWVLPVLEILEALPRPQRQALLDIEPRVLVEVIEPYLSDRPGKIFPLASSSIEERDRYNRS